MVKLKPKIFVDYYSHILEIDEFSLEDIDVVFASLVPYNKPSHPWELFVILNDWNTYWLQESLETGLVEDYLLDYEALREFENVTNFSLEELKQIYHNNRKK